MSTTVVYVQVDPDEVVRLLEKVEFSISSPVLAAFLSGPWQQWYEDTVVSRFSDGIDQRTGMWSALHEATEGIRHTLGYERDWPINIRTGSLFDLVTSYQTSIVNTMPGVEWITPPEGQASPTDQQKLETAQMGTTSNPIPEFGPTVPRPVIGWDQSGDLQMFMELLQRNIIRIVKT